ncbi:hypothetical protein ASF73_20305 [Xanthomonas sp. Leaf131]|nr:hypothetical protein ASF73_20305 [Xanthomonas sp. Leaf131]
MLAKRSLVGKNTMQNVRRHGLGKGFVDAPAGDGSSPPQRNDVSPSCSDWIGSVSATRARAALSIHAVDGRRELACTAHRATR